MISQRQQRIRKPKVIWEAVANPRDHSTSQTVPKAPRTTKQRAPTSLPVGSLPASLPSYTPQLKFRKKQGKPLFTNLTPIETFQKFVDIQIIQLVVENTNSYAARHREDNSLPQTRRWKPTTNGEIYRYIGVWLYMSMHHEAQRQVY
jgi:Transposase IS4